MGAQSMLALPFTRSKLMTGTLMAAAMAFTALMTALPMKTRRALH
jgi:hypothetical protein